MKHKRKYKPATDQLFLDRIADGTLVVDVQAAKVYTVADGQQTEMRQYATGRHKNYLAVRCYRNGHRKQIALHRLVWMAANGRLVPEGYDVDHRDHDTLNNAIDNLQLRPSVNNQHPHTRSEEYAEEETF